jgi:hypothetical protein
MARDGNGNYSLPQAAFQPNTTISSAAVNSNLSDIAAALSGSLSKDGQTAPTANLAMGGYRHTGVGNGDARNQYAAIGQVQDQSFSWCGTAGGTANAVVLSPSPPITAYTAGQRFVFLAAAANTDAVTVAVSGLDAVDCVLGDAALVPGQIAGNSLQEIVYDGATFQLTTTVAALLARATDGLGAPVLINGAFQIWQRGPGPFSAAGYTADRWSLSVGSGAAASISRETIDLADRGAGGAYALRLTRTAAGSSATSIEQRIEGVHRLAGGVAAVAARCRAAGETAIDVIVRQYFGTGGSPSTTVDTTIGTITAGTSWSTMSVSGSVPDMSGKTLGTDGNDYVAIIFSVATTEATGAVDFDWITVSSNTATPYATEDPTDTLRRCQRYYHRTDGGGFGSNGTLAAVQGTPVTNAFLTFVHPARMRTTPTVGLFTSAGNSAWRNLRAGVDVSVSAVGGSPSATSVSSSVGTSGDALQGHIILDAEL